VSGGHQHRTNLEPVLYPIDIGDCEWRNGRVVEVDAEPVGCLVVETAVTTVADPGDRDRIVGAQDLPAQAASASFLVAIVAHDADVRVSPDR
jgi:hypothetical protein